MKWLLALALAGGWGTLLFFASIGVYHYFGLLVQALCIPVFFTLGVVGGVLGTRWALR